MRLLRTVRSQMPRPLLPTAVLLLWMSGTAVGTFVLCPYCDPNYNAYPNLEVGFGWKLNLWFLTYTEAELFWT
jgi:hypothetical protein